MKANRNLGDVLELKDLARSQLTISRVATIDNLPNNYSITKINEVGVFVGANGAHFLDISNARKPKIIGSVALIHDNMYANQFLGIRGKHALFSIAYQGVEIVDINDLTTPKSLGLNKNYGFPYKMLIANSLGITNTNILDITDTLNPRAVKEFARPSPDHVIYSESLVYIPGGEDIEIISLAPSENFKQLTTLKCPFHYGFSNLERLSEKYLLAASGNGLAVAEISETADSLKLKALVKLDIIPDNFVLTDRVCITRTIRNPDDVLISLNVKNPDIPSLSYSLLFENHDLWYFMANKDFLACLCTAGLERQVPKKSVLVLTNNTTLPGIIGEIKIEMSSGFWLVDNCIYEFTKEGMNIHEIH
ncbi:MAG: hypothetical protein M0Z60_12325 [Nitrospiraceae bacterium]|nr:hypothetical protein [Nitrospiraceae bacterium]